MIFLITLIVLLALMVVEGDAIKPGAGPNQARTAAQK